VLEIDLRLPQGRLRLLHLRQIHRELRFGHPERCLGGPDRRALRQLVRPRAAYLRLR
jgi:hypothetical protein